MSFIPIEELDAFIAAGWGSVRRDRIPPNWKDVPGPGEVEEVIIPETKQPKRPAVVRTTEEKLAIQREYNRKWWQSRGKTSRQLKRSA